MTKTEFLTIAKTMQDVYTQQNFMAKKDTVDVWYTLFQNIPYKIMAAAVQAHIMTEKFPPTPADINAQLQKLRSGNADSLPTAEEAFALVRKATRNSNYHAEEEFEKLPKIVQDAVGTYQNLQAWGGMDIGEFETVQKSHFVRIYNALVAREKSEERLPGNIRGVVEAARSNPALDEIKNPMKQIDAPKMPAGEKLEEKKRSCWTCRNAKITMDMYHGFCGIKGGKLEAKTPCDEYEPKGDADE